MQSFKILVIDDEPAILAVVKVSLEMLRKWQVLTASQAKEGLDIAKSEKPDVILLDVMMSDLDGLTILGELRSDPNTQNIQVILLSGLGNSLEEDEYSDLAIAGVITKPFEPLELDQKIEEILS